MRLRGSALVVRANRSWIPNRLLVILAVAFYFLGCSYATEAPRVVKGEPFEVEQHQKIRDGLSAAEAEAVLGPPFEIRSDLDGEHWRYFSRIQKDGVTFILGVFPKRTTHFIWDYELTFTVNEGIIEAVHYKETQIK